MILAWMGRRMNGNESGAIGDVRALSGAERAELVLARMSSRI